MTGPRVLLAGMPRSGTTWAAAALGAALGCPQRMEPFHPDKAPEAYRSAAWRYRRAGDADPQLDRAVLDAFADDPVVVKDVHALLAVERIAAVAHPAVVLLSRHPVAVAASWARVGWLADDLAGARLGHLAEQHDLLEDHLGAHGAALARTHDPLHNLGALWGAVHRVWQDQIETHPEWALVRHEDLCAAPKPAFEALLVSIGVTLSDVGDVVLGQFLDHFDADPGPDHDPFSISRRTASEPTKAKSALPRSDAGRVLAAAEAFEVGYDLR